MIGITKCPNITVQKNIAQNDTQNANIKIETNNQAPQQVLISKSNIGVIALIIKENEKKRQSVDHNSRTRAANASAQLVQNHQESMKPLPTLPNINT